MKILHVRNVAGVAGLLAQDLRQRKIEADLVEQAPHKYGFPKDKVLKASNAKFLFHFIKICRARE